ncbi:MAG: hypothetical protein ACP5I6_07090 [Caldisphaera sp.]|jgi:ABC-2 type transport system permease protein|uniref:hypothetical protein n=1 Tax=Caldisphaera sp. TaxID=2060322 RepID=UPI003D10E3CB
MTFTELMDAAGVKDTGTMTFHPRRLSRLAARIRSWRLLQLVTQIASFALTFLAPVYFPLSVVSRYLLPLVMMEPTTYVAQAVRLSLMRSPFSLAWDLTTLFYGLIFGTLPI